MQQEGGMTAKIVSQQTYQSGWSEEFRNRKPELSARRRQLILDILATWRAYYLARAERVQQHLELAGVSDQELDIMTGAILQYLAAAGRVA
jgi:hypothetical protein